MRLSRSVIERLVYGAESFHRFTQDSPVLADVWMVYGDKPTEPQDVILTPRFGSKAPRVAAQLREQLKSNEPADRQSQAEVAHNQVYVVGRLLFGELIRHVLPMTRWWEALWSGLQRPGGPSTEALLVDETLVEHRPRLLAAMRRLGQLNPGENVEASVHEDDGRIFALADVPWFVRLVGAVQLAAERSDDDAMIDDLAKLATPGNDLEVDLFDSARRVLLGTMFVDHHDDTSMRDDVDEAVVWLVNVNRPVGTAVARSRLAVKADAAQRVFGVSTSALTWAVIDGGIDATLRAFWDDPKKNPEDPEWWKRTRVTATYDFTRIRHLLDPIKMLEPERQPPEIRQLMAQVSDDNVDELRDNLLNGRMIDWGVLKPFLRVPHDHTYTVPRSPHGTHVAGILAANLESEGIVGICPDIRLYDLRVLGNDAPNDEFTVLAALQFVEWLNSQKDFYAVHGVNMSLSIRHDVANFACGRTPVCDQCEDVVASGVVVVAAAGNEGYLRYATADGRGFMEGYHTMSISDPGNARTVITVGSTHRDSPHTYGVSYFSSRGPTGDGRVKPDLVAPGEKITSLVPGGGLQKMDGTSMAAPHVSGACAMLMARHNELIGEPQRVKEALCSTATDLGREPYFQGAGMLDVLRALQSI